MAKFHHGPEVNLDDGYTSLERVWNEHVQTLRNGALNEGKFLHYRFISFTFISFVFISFVFITIFNLISIMEASINVGINESKSIDGGAEKSKVAFDTFRFQNDRQFVQHFLSSFDQRVGQKNASFDGIDNGDQVRG